MLRIARDLVVCSSFVLAVGLRAHAQAASAASQALAGGPSSSVTRIQRAPATGFGLPLLASGLCVDELRDQGAAGVDERRDGYKALTIRGFEALSVESLRELNDRCAARDEELSELRRLLSAAAPPASPSRHPGDG